MNNSIGKSKQTPSKVIASMVVEEVNSRYGKKSNTTLLATNTPITQKIYINNNN